MENKIKVGVIGVGNCFSGLFQGLELYRTTLKDKDPIGLTNPILDKYSIFDVDFVAAWDVGANKIDKPLTEAIYEKPNMVNWTGDSIEISDWFKRHGDVIVEESPVLDGVGIYVENKINPRINRANIDDLALQIIGRIKKSGVEILLNYLPVGSEEATKFWAQIALESGCGFINCMPVFIASDPEWAEKFVDAGLPVLGDDMKGQVGATIVHRVLAKMANDRGVKIDSTYQLNVGGNSDFLNMKEQERLVSKKISKTDSVQSQLEIPLDADKVHIGPSDFIPYLGNTKIAFINLKGKQWAEIPYSIELRLEVDDKANSAGVVIDAIRLAKIALDRKEGGAIIPASAFLFKHPPQQFSDQDAKKILEDYANGK